MRAMWLSLPCVGVLLASSSAALACPRAGVTKGITSQDRINLGKPLNHKFNTCEAQISANGQTLYFNYYHACIGGPCGVYRSSWNGTSWSEAEMLVPGGDMPTVTRDESRVYFTGALAGPGSQGVWMIERQSDGGFGRPSQVRFQGGTPPGIWTVAVGPDGNRMVYKANNLNSGGEDLFMSTRDPTTDVWSAPSLLGLPISGSDKEWHPFITYDGKKLIYSSNSPEVVGRGAGRFKNHVTMVSNWNEATGTWDAPTELGEFGCSPSITEDGAHLYYGGRFEGGGHGGLDTWTEKLSPVTKERREEWPGLVTPKDSRWCSLGRLPGAVSAGALASVGDGALLAMSSEGAIFRLEAPGAGSSWQQVQPPVASCLSHLHEDRPMVDILVLPDGTTALAATSAELVRSTDGGRSWRPVTAPTAVVGARALARAGDGTLYAGTQSGSVLRSIDGGLTWTLRGSLPLAILGMAVDNRGRLYLAGMGLLKWGDPTTIRSDDGGATFQVVPIVGNEKHVDLSLAYSFLSASDGSLYASVWVHGEFEKTDVFRSTDGATLRWTSKIPGAWWDDRVMTFVETGGTVYAGVATNEDGELVFTTQNGGAAWTSTGSLLPAREVFDLAALADGTIAAATGPFGEVFRLRSTPNGGCWTQAPDAGLPSDAGSNPSPAPSGCPGCISFDGAGAGAMAVALLLLRRMSSSPGLQGSQAGVRP